MSSTYISLIHLLEESLECPLYTLGDSLTGCCLQNNHRSNTSLHAEQFKVNNDFTCGFWAFYIPVARQNTVDSPPCQEILRKNY